MTQRKHCPQCAKQLPSWAGFCSRCGVAVAAYVATPPMPARSRRWPTMLLMLAAVFVGLLVVGGFALVSEPEAITQKTVVPVPSASAGYGVGMYSPQTWGNVYAPAVNRPGYGEAAPLRPSAIPLGYGNHVANGYIAPRR